jgi:hypothetical protein
VKVSSHFRSVSLVLLLIGIAQRAEAVRHCYEFQGTITEYYVEYVPDLGISVGDSFFGTLSYTMPPFGDWGAVDPEHNSFVNLDIKVRGHTFAPWGEFIYTSILNRPPGSSDIISVDSFQQATNPWGVFLRNWILLSVFDPTGTVLSGAGQPPAVILPVGAYGFWRFSGDTGHHDIEFAEIAGQISSIRRVPENEGSGGLLLLALVPLVGYGLLRKLA